MWLENRSLPSVYCAALHWTTLEGGWRWRTFTAAAGGGGGGGGGGSRGPDCTGAASQQTRLSPPARPASPSSSPPASSTSSPTPASSPTSSGLLTFFAASSGLSVLPRNRHDTKLRSVFHLNPNVCKSAQAALGSSKSPPSLVLPTVTVVKTVQNCQKSGETVCAGCTAAEPLLMCDGAHRSPMTPAQPNPPPPTAPTQSSCEHQTGIRSSAKA